MGLRAAGTSGRCVKIAACGMVVALLLLTQKAEGERGERYPPQGSSTFIRWFSPVPYNAGVDIAAKLAATVSSTANCSQFFYSAATAVALTGRPIRKIFRGLPYQDFDVVTVLDFPNADAVVGFARCHRQSSGFVAVVSDNRPIPNKPALEVALTLPLSQRSKDCGLLPGCAKGIVQLWAFQFNVVPHPQIAPAALNALNSIAVAGRRYYTQNLAGLDATQPPSFFAPTSTFKYDYTTYQRFRDLSALKNYWEVIKDERAEKLAIVNGLQNFTNLVQWDISKSVAMPGTFSG